MADDDVRLARAQAAIAAMTIRTDARASGRMDPSASVEPLSPATSAAVSAASAASPIATWHGIPQEPLEPIRPFVNSSEEKLYPASLKTSTEVSVHNTEPTKVPPPIAALTGTLGQRHVICVIGLPCSGQIPVAHTMRHYLEFMHGADVKCFDVNEFSAATPEANREELLSAVGAHLMSERRMSSAAASQIRPLVGTVLSDDRFHNVDPGKVAIVFDSDAAAHGDVPRGGTCERCETWSCSTKRSRRWVVQQLAELSTSTPISTTFVEVVIDDPAMLRAHLSLYDPQRAKAPAAPRVGNGPLALFEHAAPSASLDGRRAWASPTHRRAHPEHLGGLPWPQELASGRPNVEGWSTFNPAGRADRGGARRAARRAPRVQPALHGDPDDAADE